MKEDRDTAGDAWDEEELRIARARATIDRNFEELIHRAGGDPESPPRKPSPPPPETTSAHTEPATPVASDPPEAWGVVETEDQLEARVSAASAAIEQRIGEWVSSRVKAAERRLELQSSALEAALGRTQLDEASEALAGLREEAVAGATAEAEHAVATGLGELEKILTAYIEAGQGSARVEIEKRLSAATEQLARTVEERGRELELELERRAGELTQRAAGELERALGHLGSSLERDAEVRLRTLRRELTEDHSKTVAEGEAAARAAIAAAVELESAKAEARLAVTAERVELVGDEQAERLREAKDETAREVAEAATATARAQLETAAAGAEVQAEAMRAAAGERMAELASEGEARLMADLDRRVEDRVSSGLERRSADLERVVEERLAAVEDRSGKLESELQKRVDLLKAEVEESRQELEKRSIKAERKRLTLAYEEHLSVAESALAAKRDEMIRTIAGEAMAAGSKATKDVERRLAKAREELLSAKAAGVARGEAAVAAALGEQADQIERRLTVLNERNIELGERRLAATAEVLGSRIASADRAQQREEEVRRRTEAASAAAESRVRAAEQRLVEVLAEVDLAERAIPRSSPRSG